MARPRTFDETKVLDATIACFWRDGYEATSMRALESGTGLKGPSLYNAFGDKRALFRLALERYADRSARARIKRLDAHPDPAAAIGIFFEDLIAISLDDVERRGCFIVNTALEIAPHDPEIGAAIDGYLGEIRAFFLRCLDRAAAAGRLSPRANREELSQMLLGLVLGVRVAARAAPARVALDGMVHPALRMIFPDGKLARRRRR
ncbi:MAG: TetR family transcriptional regulator [Alphaproteobacteria bacterium]|nr:TetR family transcriptional regulator [Alphaproteobacteria bacterium]